jgi:hypothetical protein
MSTAEEMEAGRWSLARRHGRATGTSANRTTEAAQPATTVAAKPGENGSSPIASSDGTIIASISDRDCRAGETGCPTHKEQTPPSGPAGNKFEDEVTQFLTRVVPWPQDDASPGYINVHWTIPQQAGKPRWTGKPVRSVAEFQGLVHWVLSRPNAGDIYYCLSLQSKAGVNKHGNPIAERSLQNVLTLKALWLDLDVKEPPKGYASVEEAWFALKAFYEAVGMPRPSALVKSGGGLHVYWISKTPLTLEQWRPLATGLKNAAVKHGLRCDACCTVDAARILRVPGTWNCKNEPKRPVRLVWLGEDYDF